ncbi:MAG: hypothetical protein K8I82_00155 [Anaerolineae bacterium]|nr:hypothetical protein [Anaerolineae bacterium]
MQIARNFWKAFRNFAIIFSFIMNFVLVVILLIVVREIFIIKNGIAEPLIDGLHSNFVGMDEANITTTIAVEDTIIIDFDLPISQNTTVILTSPVPLSASAAFALPGGGGTINGQVNLSLPVGLELPVQLNMVVPVEQEIPISLSVPVDIPLNETELHAPFVNLKNLLEPYVRSLDNLPQDWDKVPDFVMDAAQGDVNLLEETEGSRNPWQTPTPQDMTVIEETQQPNSETPPVGTGGPEATQEVVPPTTEPGAPTATTVPLLLPTENITSTETPEG